MNKKLYEIPSSEAYEVSLEENILSMEDPNQKPTEDWDNP